MAGRKKTPYDPELVDWICEQIATTDKGVEPILADWAKKHDKSPRLRMIWEWLKEYPEFQEQYNEAKQAQAELLSARIVQEATTPRMQTIVTEGPRGIETKTSDNVQRSQLIVQALELRAGQLAPQKYGKLLKHEVAGKDGGAIQTEHRIVFVDPPQTPKPA